MEFVERRMDVIPWVINQKPVCKFRVQNSVKEGIPDRTQMYPSPANFSWHTHSYDPSVMEQVAFVWHGLLVHASMSEVDKEISKFISGTVKTHHSNGDGIIVY